MSESADTTGTLKVFLGMCPGVGKTYAMLEAARALKSHGVDVVAGVVVTHARKETQALLDGIEVLPAATSEHRGATIHELDLDALLARRPEVALVDELAHTNAPGSRHPKRWQDVAELLDAGINVYTTINIQHLESRADIVSSITNAPVRETVPDSFLDRANEIELIDLTPRDLRRRLDEGKVYLGDRARAAADHFFKESHLTALRQLALRYTAERVGIDLNELRAQRRSRETWRSGERLIVAVGASPYSPALIRRTRAMAGALDAPWSAIAVTTGEPLSKSELELISEHLSLARKLGAEATTVEAVSLVDGLLSAARERGTTQIVIGKSPRTRWTDFFIRPPALELLRQSGDIDVIAIEPKQGETAERKPQKPAFDPTAEIFRVVGLTAAIAILGIVTSMFLGEQTVALLMLCGVIIGALFLTAPGTWALALLTGLAWNYFTTEPRYTFNIRSSSDVALFFALTVAAVAMGHLSGRLRRRERSVSRQRVQYSRLLDINTILTSSHDTDEMLAKFTAAVSSRFHLDCAIRLRNEVDHKLGKPHPSSTLSLTEKDRGVSEWTFDHRQPAGRGTNTLAESPALHLPLQGRSFVMGVISVDPGTTLLPLAERDQLSAIAAQLGIALERDHLLHAIHHAEFIERGDQLRRSLLDHVSHELRTPVAIISTAIDALARGATADTLLSEMEGARDRLKRVVEQLVQSARVESGAIAPQAEWCDLLDLLETARDRTSVALADRPLSIAIDAGSPALVRVDAELVLAMVENLLANAGNHTPGGTAIEMRAFVSKDGQLEISVRDHGPGLKDPTTVFDRFHRENPRHPGGLGLGLSIVRGIARGLGGSAEARHAAGGGAEFILRFPVQSATEIPTP
ncbi:sensor histidine kinase KdpD [Luteolibacter pohnpeiensis]|uniref:histidine kinase n=1 Tax=Luteolibacter pohnpeiensis TaxID=454153 RepID=A0A934S7M3_9BACT|nr:ATP-binding protein [Luteolibacter pohnpeiensis]MBK1884575.1 sensor histidine kinase KdpD [Luteolibacter pohnpeiensis]